MRIVRAAVSKWQPKNKHGSIQTKLINGRQSTWICWGQPEYRYGVALKYPKTAHYRNYCRWSAWRSSPFAITMNIMFRVIKQMQHDTMQTGMVARRRQPLMSLLQQGLTLTVLVTTCVYVFNICCRQCARWWAVWYIWTIEDGDEWTDPKVLAKANPNYDVSICLFHLESQQT